MRKLILRSSIPLLVVLFLALAAGSMSAKEKSTAGVRKALPYSRALALKTLVNPHEQINDEGEILWGVCLVCHKSVPDLTVERQVDMVELRVEGEFKNLCYKCHTVKKHPATKGTIGGAMSYIFAEDHLVEPTKVIALNRQLAMKEVYTSLPLDPSTGKVTCVTCHNPHEKGVLKGRGDWGADSVRRLRSEGLEICQYCHRK